MTDKLREFTLESALAECGERPHGPDGKPMKDDNEWLLIAYERTCFDVAGGADVCDRYGFLRGQILDKMGRSNAR